MPPNGDGSRVREYIDWGVRGLVSGLIVAAIATFAWSKDTEKRVDALERYEPRIVKLEARDESYRDLRTDIAVVQTKLDELTKQVDRVGGLLEKR